MAWLNERRAGAKSSLIGARIVGEAGVGKTRLLRELVSRAQADGDAVVETGPDPSWAEIGYYALRRAIQKLAALPASGGDSHDWLTAGAEARQGLDDIFGLTNGVSHAKSSQISPEERRYAAAEALRWALVRASENARGNRVLLAVDDLHNVDGASRNAFADAISEPPLVGALVVVTHAPGFDPSWSSGTVSSRVLTGLPTAEVARVFASAPESGTPLLVGERLVSPLYLQQLLHFIREQGAGAPPRLADLIALRVERMSTDARRVLQAIAVWGDDATDEALMQLLPEETDLVEALGHLRRMGMIEVQETGFRTTHPLLREVVLATIPATARRDFHAKAAEICNESGAPIELRAMHAYFAGDAFEALILLERISTGCSARGDISGAILMLRRGLELARRELFRGELDDPMRAVLIFSRKLGEALAKMGALTDAEGVLREALDVAAPAGPDRARVLGALASVAHGRERKQDAEAYLREALELASRSGAHELLTSLQTLKRSIAS
jgi:serine/threonine-protein kinase